MVGFNRRFAPMTVRMKSFLAPISEPLALHYRVNAGHLPPDHWVNDREQGGGRILGEVCHFVDLLMFLAGSPDRRGGGSSARQLGRATAGTMCWFRFVSRMAPRDRSVIWPTATDHFPRSGSKYLAEAAPPCSRTFVGCELVREWPQRNIHSRWRQDKGHRAEWAAFAQAVQRREESRDRVRGIGVLPPSQRSASRNRSPQESGSKWMPPLS